MPSILSLNIAGISENDSETDKQYRWLKLHAENQGLPATAYHTCNLVLDPERYNLVKLITIFSSPDVKLHDHKVKYEGIYYFGGKNELGASNDLYILSVGRRPLEWIKPEIRTKKPPPRYGHTAEFFSDKSILVVFGGRNDDTFEISGTFCMNDIWVFSAETLEWKEWVNNGSPKQYPEARYSHCSAILGKSVIIFGGLNDANYCGSKLYEIDMMGKKTELKRVPRINSLESINPVTSELNIHLYQNRSKESLPNNIIGINKKIANSLVKFSKRS